MVAPLVLWLDGSIVQLFQVPGSCYGMRVTGSKPFALRSMPNATLPPCLHASILMVT